MIGPDSGACRQRRFALERVCQEPFVVGPFGAPPHCNLFTAFNESLMRRVIAAALAVAR